MNNNNTDPLSELSQVVNTNCPNAQQITQFLSQILQFSDPQEQKHAEQYLFKFANESDKNLGELCLITAFVALDKNGVFQPWMKQLGAVYLKRLVKLHWDELGIHHENDDDDDEQPFIEVPPAVKILLRKCLPLGLSDPNSKVRNAVAMAIAAIAHFDWPSEWPSLMQDLAGCLRSQDKNLVHGAISCLEMYTDGGNLSDDFIPSLYEVLFPELYRMFVDSQVQASIRTKVVSVVASLVEWLSFIKNKQKNVVEFFFEKVLPGWMGVNSNNNNTPGFLQFLNPVLNPITAESDCSIQAEILAVLLILINEFPKRMKAYIPPLIENVWVSFVNGLSVYQKTAIDEIAVDQEFTSDGDPILKYEVLVVNIIDFLRMVNEHSPLRPILKSHLPAIMYVLIGYMQITAEQEEIWISDPNEFVSEEGQTEVSNSTRSAALLLIGELIDTFEKVALKALTQAITQRFNESNSWKIREAGIQAVGWVYESFLESQILDIPSFVGMLAQDMTSQASPFIRGRALWCIANFAEALDPNSLEPFLAAIASALQNKAEPFPVKVGACQALGTVASRTNSPAIFKKYLSVYFEEVIQMIPNATIDTLQLLLDTLSRIVVIDGEATAHYESTISPLLLSTWSKNLTDPWVTDSIQEIFQGMARNPSLIPVIEDRLLQSIAQTISSPNQASGIVQASLGLLAMLISYQTKLSEKIMSIGFMPLIGLMLSTKDGSIMQKGIQCLNSIVERGADQLAQWQPENNGSALSMIIQVPARMLNAQEMSEDAAIPVGSLLTRLLLSAGPHISPLLPDIINSIVLRVPSVQNRLLKQSLLLVIARLARSHTSQLLDLLSNLTVNNENGLVVLLNEWTNTHEDFKGEFSLKLSIDGLVKIFSCNDSRLSQIALRGDLIVDPNEGIVTRSKKKEMKYQQVGVRVRILQVLAMEYRRIKEEENELKNPEIKFHDDDDEGQYESENDQDDDDVEMTQEEYERMLKGGDLYADAEAYDQDDTLINEFELDAKNDQLSQVSLKGYIARFFVAFSQAEPNTLREMVSQMPNQDQITIAKIFQ